MAAALSGRIVELERRLDAVLCGEPTPAGRSRASRDAARAWSDAVWEAARDAGPVPLDRAALEAGFALGHRPVFICGAHRSGTTLVRDLLDAHPALSVLPAEGSFLTGLEPRLRCHSSDRQLEVLGREWLQRLANPINQPPFWLLGRSTEDRSPYVTFARALTAWWQAADRRHPQNGSLWPLVTVALAYAFCTNGLAFDARLERWVEKTPLNERFLGRLWQEFPAARIVHVVRNPLHVVASRKRLEERATGSFRCLDRVLADLARSYRVALTQSPVGGSTYHLLRYEALIANPRDVVDGLARFLEIEPLPILWHPTVAGVPAHSNSSFTAGAAAGEILADAAAPRTDLLTRREADRVSALVGDLAGRLGYRVPLIGRWKARLLRLTHPRR